MRDKNVALYTEPDSFNMSILAPAMKLSFLRDATTIPRVRGFFLNVVKYVVQLVGEIGFLLCYLLASSIHTRARLSCHSNVSAEREVVMLPPIQAPLPGRLPRTQCTTRCRLRAAKFVK